MISTEAPARIACPRFLTAGARRAWRRLDTPTDTGERFSLRNLSGLPEAVVHWLEHAIAPGAPLLHGVRLEMHGDIRVGRWRPFTARQILTPGGFIWAAQAGRLPARISGHDRYADDAGEMRWRLLGLIPVMSRAGGDITRSAAGRHAAEALMLTPATALSSGVEWERLDAHRAIATVASGPFTHRVTLEVDDSGAPRFLTLPRWGDPAGREYAEHPFDVSFTGERRFGDYTLPATLRAGWRYGEHSEPGEFFRCAIDRAEFF